MYTFQSKLFTKRAIQFLNLACTCQFWKQCSPNVNKIQSQLSSVFQNFLWEGSKKMSQRVNSQAHIDRNTIVNCLQRFDPSFLDETQTELLRAAYNCSFGKMGL